MSKRRATDAGGHMISGLFSFALFGVFVLLSLLIVVIGVNGYRNVVNTGDSVGEVRTAMGYVAGKLRSDAATNGVRLVHEADVDALVLTEEYDGNVYETYIFHRDGALYELTMRAGRQAFDPEDGWRLAAVTSFSAEKVDDHLLRLSVTAQDGRAQTLHIAVRTAEVVVP